MEEKRWTLPICTGCGGILGYGLNGGCTCEPSHAKTGKSIEVCPVTELELASLLDGSKNPEEGR